MGPRFRERRFIIQAVLAVGLLGLPLPLAAQDNYEIQVYGSDTVPKGATMFELHSNFTVKGLKGEDGALSGNHALHETLEITHGWNDWFETGWYLMTSVRSGAGWDWVGDHIRPRVRAPASWGLPVGLSLSTEIGYQRPLYSPDTWTLELRPIIDKQWAKTYLSLNPTLDRSLHGPGASRGFEFSPNAKASYAVSKRINAGVEYYGSLGPLTGFDPISRQYQLIVPAIDLNLGPDWEFNLGVGVGVTGGTDHLIIKLILGRLEL